jgi:hypothetical protein
MQSIRDGHLGSSVISFYPTAAHLDRPSFLEINMAESILSVGLKDAIGFVCDHFKDSHRADRVRKVTDGIITVLEIHSAFKNNSTVGENYMGLIRVNTKGRRRPANLNNIQRLVTVAEAVLVPFLMKQEKWNFAITNYKFVRAIFSILYIANATRFYSPFHWLVGISIARRKEGPSSQASMASRLTSALIWFLVYSIQLGQWYFQNEDILNPRRPPSQMVNYPKQRENGLPADPRTCPLCLSVRTNATADIRTGIIYCYTCIVKKIRTDSPGANASKFTRRLVSL